MHLNEIETAGRYWSVTKYDDIKTVSSDWETFSSAYGMTLGFRVGSQLPAGPQFGAPAFISQDPPRHENEGQPPVPVHGKKADPCHRASDLTASARDSCSCFADIRNPDVESKAVKIPLEAWEVYDGQQ